MTTTETDDLDFYIDIMAAIPLSLKHNYRIMFFIDGENLAIRFGSMLGNDAKPDHVFYKKDVYVWSEYIKPLLGAFNVIRKYYYTSVIGDDNLIEKVTDDLIKAGIEEPKVFKKTKERNSKGVDISLATDMLTHAYKDNYDVAILITGDGDYIPLVEAVKNEGRRVFLWFLQDGLNKNLKRKADHFWGIERILLERNRNKLDSIVRFDGFLWNG